MTEPLPPGLYEVLVTEVLAERLAGIEELLVVSTDGVRSAEVADRVALHLNQVVERATEGVGDEDRVDVAIAVARDLDARLDELVTCGCRRRAMPPSWPRWRRSTGRSGSRGTSAPTTPTSSTRHRAVRRSHRFAPSEWLSEGRSECGRTGVPHRPHGDFPEPVLAEAMDLGQRVNSKS